MQNLSERLRILRESRIRIREFTFGEAVTNVCAGVGNPLRHAYFVKVSGDNVQITDKKGTFATIGCEVIYSGHLTAENAQELFLPFWQAQYGGTVVSASAEGK